MESSRPSITVLGTGSYVPAKVMTNSELSEMVDTTDEWITSRTGIKQRRIAASGEWASDLATKAAERALEEADLKAEEIDLIVLATLSPDMIFPSTACLVQQRLGIPGIPCFDVGAACSGFVYALETARSLMLSNPRYRRALVIGAERISSFLDWTDRTTCVLFGDGAGAFVLGRSETREVGILDCLIGSDGSKWDLIHMPGGGSTLPPSPATIEDRSHFLKMNGREVFKLAVREMERCAREILAANGYGVEDVDCFIPHQANMRIIDHMVTHMGIDPKRLPNNLQNYGNTSAASVPLAMDEAVRAGQIREGSLVLLVAFGAGLTWGASLIRWGT
ncbi:MAG: beta-ketoacyl-ACP synthase III [Puniceicoccaceae bacterium]